MHEKGFLLKDLFAEIVENVEIKIWIWKLLTPKTDNPTHMLYAHKWCIFLCGDKYDPVLSS